MKTLFIAVVTAGILFSTNIEAQFHKKDKNGSTQVNEQTRAAIQAGQQQAANQSGEMLQMNFAIVNGRPVPTQTAAVFKPEKVWDGEKYVKRNVELAYMDKKNVFEFSKLVTHSDGSYTESVRDMQRSNYGKNKTTIQTTKSANGVTLRTREVLVDETGFPTEVIIRDAIGRFKYRGEMVYERSALAQKLEGDVVTVQRLKEELIYDPDSNLVRRIVHNYDAKGLPEPDIIHDYVENVPEDLQLVIYKGDAQIDPALNGEVTRGEKWYPGKKAIDRMKAKKDDGDEEQETGVVQEPNKTGGGLFRGFRNRKN